MSVYTIVYAGNIDLIFTVPHSSVDFNDFFDQRNDTLFLNKTWINNTDKPQISTKPDINTDIFAKTLTDKISQEIGARPYIVINTLNRMYADVNRDFTNCCHNNYKARYIWEDYHLAINRVIKQRGNALILDIHGHFKRDNSIYLGYLIPKSYFDKDITYINSSVEWLSLYSGIDKESLIRGNKSLGYLIEKYSKGITCYPSLNNSVIRNKRYFSGGYTLKRYSSMSNVSVIQVEIANSLRFPEIDNIFVENFKVALMYFLNNTKLM